MWDSVVEVLLMVVQLLSQVPSCFLYSQRLSVALPVTEEPMVSAPPAMTPVTDGLAGFGGRVGKAVAVASSVAQALSL